MRPPVRVEGPQFFVLALADEAVDPWIDKVNEASANLLMSKIPSWQTGVNRNVEGRQVPRVLGYNGGAVRYRRMIAKQVAEGYPEFLFR